MNANHSTRSGGIIGCLLNYLQHEGMLCVLIRIASSRRFYLVAQYTIFNMKTKVSLDYPKSAAMGFFSEGHKKEFETAMVRVNEPPVFRPLKFYYTYINSRVTFKAKMKVGCS